MAPMGIYDGGKADPKHRRHQACEVRVRRPGGNPFTPSMPILPGMPIPDDVDNYSYCIKGSASPSTSPNRQLNQSDASDGPHSNTRVRRERKQARKAAEADAARGKRKRSLSPSSSSSSASSSASSPPPKKQRTDSRPPAKLKLRNPDFVKPQPRGYEGWRLQQQAFREEKERKEAEAHKAWLEKSAAESEDDDVPLIDTPLQGFAQPVSGHGGNVGEETESDGESTEPDEETVREGNDAAHLLLDLQYRQERERIEAARALRNLRDGSEQERQRREEAAQGLMSLYYGVSGFDDEVNGASQTPSDLRSTLYR